MLKFCSLYSGSTGNSLYVESDNTKLLIDAGVSAKKISDALTSINVDISNINGILITHEHTDHIQGLNVISKKYNIPIFANEKTWKSMEDKVNAKNKYFFINSKEFEIGDLKIHPFDIPHDAADPCGFNIYNKDKKISIATDLGHITESIIGNLENSSFIMLESNYDPEVLKCCSYPYNLKVRIAGPNGHLPNSLAGKTIAHLIHTGLKSVTLGHLSKENNFPELAYNTVLEELRFQNISIDSIQLNVASRFQPGPFMEVG